jgi:hypothetical protein
MKGIGNQGRGEYPTYSKKNVNWVGYVMRRISHLKYVIEGRIEGRIQVTEIRGRRRNQILDYVKEMRSYGKLKEEALDLTMWGTHFGRVSGPVVSQTM